MESLRLGWGGGANAFAEEQWAAGPAMCTPRTALGAATVAGHIYAVGGQVCQTFVLLAFGKTTSADQSSFCA